MDGDSVLRIPRDILMELEIDVIVLLYYDYYYIAAYNSCVCVRERKRDLSSHGCALLKSPTVLSEVFHSASLHSSFAGSQNICAPRVFAHYGVKHTARP